MKINLFTGERLDYSEVVFARGMVCFNTNNHNKCIVLEGELGTESDRCSKTLELSSNGLVINTPSNKVLIPTGEYIDLSWLERVLKNE